MWFYNTKLGRWYHPTGATSDNSPNDPPVYIPVDAVVTPSKPIEAPKPTGCVPCGHKTRQVR